MNMKKTIAKQLISELLQNAGITINGNCGWDIRVHNEDTYSRVLHQGILGLGETYMEKWWECNQLDEFVYRILRANLEKSIEKNLRFYLKFLLAKVINFQTKQRALEVGKKHYDLGNILFGHMLDTKMNYTCGYWKNAANLEEAQNAKLDLVCQKLQLKPGMRILDIGCGWGALAKHAAENYGVSVVGITISKEQIELAKQKCFGLPIDLRLQDYRDLNEKFDRIASLGMFEHVGHRNYRDYMQVVHRCLDDNGLFLLHTIGSSTTTYKTNDWTEKYIFSNGMIPSISQIGTAVENLFVMEDWHNFGADYYKTLIAWYDNFKNNWEKIREHYDEKFYRMWSFYLLSSAGSFKARNLQLWQVVFSKNGLSEGYRSIR
jgi:cyclopropane-fatty-acyl-phospholipid synthase